MRLEWGQKAVCSDAACAPQPGHAGPEGGAGRTHTMTLTLCPQPEGPLRMPSGDTQGMGKGRPRQR